MVNLFFYMDVNYFQKNINSIGYAWTVSDRFWRTSLTILIIGVVTRQCYEFDGFFHEKILNHFRVKQLCIGLPYISTSKKSSSNGIRTMAGYDVLWHCYVHYRYVICTSFNLNIDHNYKKCIISCSVFLRLVCPLATMIHLKSWHFSTKPRKTQL